MRTQGWARASYREMPNHAEAARDAGSDLISTFFGNEAVAIGAVISSMPLRFSADRRSLYTASGSTRPSCKRTIGDLPLQEIGFSGFAGVCSFARNRQRIALHLYIYVLGINPRRHHFAMELLMSWSINASTAGENSFAYVRSSCVERPPHEPVEDLVEIPAKIDHVGKKCHAELDLP